MGGRTARAFPTATGSRLPSERPSAWAATSRWTTACGWPPKGSSRSTAWSTSYHRASSAYVRRTRSTASSRASTERRWWATTCSTRRGSAAGGVGLVVLAHPRARRRRERSGL